MTFSDYLEPIILFEDAELIVVAKPPLWHSVAGKTTGKNILSDWLKKTRPQLSALKESGLLSRLDFETSGCIAAAKSAQAYAKWKVLFKDPASEVEKIYYARVEGSPSSSGRFGFYFSSRYRSSQKVTVKEKGKMEELGICVWKKLQSENESSLLEVRLIGSGQRHQIRAGLAHLGFPILADSLYGHKKATSKHSVFLHSESLRLSTKIKVQAPLPRFWGEP